MWSVPSSGPQGRKGEMVTSDHLWDMRDGSCSPYSQSMGMRPERLAVLHNIQLFLHSFGWLPNSFPQKMSGRNSFLRAKCLLKPKAISAYRGKWVPSKKFIIWVILWLIWLTAVWFPREEKDRCVTHIPIIREVGQISLPIHVYVRESQETALSS